MTAWVLGLGGGVGVGLWAATGTAGPLVYGLTLGLAGFVIALAHDLRR